ncbi:Uncharacterized protein DAT39_003035, partial [Clarias magur]
PTHHECSPPRFPSPRRRDTTKPGYSSSGRRALGPGRGPLPLRPSSRSRPETASLLFAR